MSKSTTSNMSSLSKFSIKSQAHIAQQDVTIAAMRSAMLAAGLDPDSVVPIQVGPGSGIMDICNKPTATPTANSKKRMPSGSPDVKNSGSCSDNSYDDAIDIIEEEEASKANWRQYQLRKPKNSPEKKMSKKAKRLAKAKSGKAGKTGYSPVNVLYRAGCMSHYSLTSRDCKRLDV